MFYDTPRDFCDGYPAYVHVRMVAINRDFRRVRSISKVTTLFSSVISPIMCRVLCLSPLAKYNDSLWRICYRVSRAYELVKLRRLVIQNTIRQPRELCFNEGLALTSGSSVSF